jgi:hypothetical protein
MRGLFFWLVNWPGRDGRRRPAGLSDAPVEYLRMEYRGSRSGWPAGGPAERRADQDVAVRTGE